MEIEKFYAALGKQCHKGGCKKCSAQEFCYTVPASMTPEILERVVDQLNVEDIQDFTRLGEKEQEESMGIERAIQIWIDALTTFVEGKRSILPEPIHVKDQDPRGIFHEGAAIQDTIP